MNIFIAQNPRVKPLRYCKENLSMTCLTVPANIPFPRFIILPASIMLLPHRAMFASDTTRQNKHLSVISNKKDAPETALAQREQFQLRLRLVRPERPPARQGCLHLCISLTATLTPSSTILPTG